MAGRPHRIPRPCADCGRLTPGRTRCPKCERVARAKLLSAQPWRAVYDMPAYRKVRKCVLARAKGICEAVEGETRRRCGHRAVDVHHIVPISRALTWSQLLDFGLDPNNMAALCEKHHPQAHRRR